MHSYQLVVKLLIDNWHKNIDVPRRKLRRKNK